MCRPQQDRSSSASGLRTSKNCPNLSIPFCWNLLLLWTCWNTLLGDTSFLSKHFMSQSSKVWKPETNKRIFGLNTLTKGLASELHLCFPHDKSNSKCSREEGKDKASEATLHGDQNQRCELDNLWYKFNQRTLAPSGPISHLCKIQSQPVRFSTPGLFQGMRRYNTFSTIFFGSAGVVNLAPWLLKHFCGFPNVPDLVMPAKSIREAQSSSSYCANVANLGMVNEVFVKEVALAIRHWLLPILLMLDNLKEQDWTH